MLHVLFRCPDLLIIILIFSFYRFVADPEKKSIAVKAYLKLTLIFSMGVYSKITL